MKYLLLITYSHLSSSGPSPHVGIEQEIMSLHTALSCGTMVAPTDTDWKLTM